MSKNRFYDKLIIAKLPTTSDREKIVENVYNDALSSHFSGDITHPYKCDGFIESKTTTGKDVCILAEYKYDKDFTNVIDRSKVLIQVLFYLKQFENDGKTLPNIILVGDVDECFILHTNQLISYLDEKIDWSIAPSMAAENNISLVVKIAEDENINPYIFNIDENFSFSSVVNIICDFAENVVRYVHVTERNVSIIYNYFCKNVISEINKIDVNNLVAIFLGIIKDGDSYYLHPKKKNILVTPFGEVKTKTNSFERFIGYYNRKYTPQEIMLLNSISDRLIEDTKRRRSGEFYTPTLYVDMAHKYMSSVFGDDWKEKYVVWDNSWGCGNLTKDYKFGELYCSTLQQSELEIAENYNMEAISKFQYDFLNDDLEKLPPELISVFESKKPIIFFMNPPFAASGTFKKGSTKSGCANTKMNSIMKADKIGGCTQNLYAQFIYGIIMIKNQFKLTDIHIGMFTPTKCFTGSAYKGLRKILFDNFEYVSGFEFQASAFSDCSGNWSITYSILKGI